MIGGIYFDILWIFICIGIEYYIKYNKVYKIIWLYGFFFINIRIIFFKLYFLSFGNYVYVYRILFNVLLVIKFI